MAAVQSSTMMSRALLGRWPWSFAVRNRSEAYTLLQKAVGWCALTLCPIVVVSDLIFGDPTAPGAPTAGELRGSVSAYYYGVGGDWFVGALFAMAFFFFSYEINPKDEDRLVDKQLSSFAGLCAVLVALFPTALPGSDGGLVDMVHGIAAALLFISMAIFSSYHFTKTQGGSPWKLDVLGATAMAEWARGNMQRSIDAGESALAAAHAEPATMVPFDARFGLIASYGLRGRADDAHDRLTTLIREAREHQAWYHLSGAQAQVAFAFALVGFADDARQQAQAALVTAERSENTSTLSFAHHANAMVLVESDPHEALRELYESIRLASRVRNRWHLGWTASTLANLFRRLGRHDEAAEKIDDLLEHWQAIEMEPQLVSAVLESASLFDAVGDQEGVRLALTVANEGRLHHPRLPGDSAAIQALRQATPTPPPEGDEATQVNDLRDRLRQVFAST